MYSCRDFQNHLDAALDGELPPASQGDFDSHAETCAVCAALRASIESTMLDLAALARAADRAVTHTADASRREACTSAPDRRLAARTLRPMARVAAALLIAATLAIASRSWVSPRPISDAIRTAETRVQPKQHMEVPAATLESVASGGESCWAVNEKTSDARITLVWAYTAVPALNATLK